VGGVYMDKPITLINGAKDSPQRQNKHRKQINGKI
jgi:hypothetical protein